MRTLIPSVASVALILSSFVATPAAAWEPLDTCNGVHTAWPDGAPHTVWKFANNFPSDDFTQAQTLQILEDSFAEWSLPGCSDFTVTRGPDTSADPFAYNSDRAVGFYEDSFPPSLGYALAVTFPSWNWDCEMIDASMIFNGDDFDWNWGPSGNDLQSVATHEAGHWVGLDHSGYWDSTMTATYSGGTGDRVLSCDDTEASCTLYPSGGTACGTPGNSDYCPCGQSCVNGWCGGTQNGPPWDGGGDTPSGSDGDDDADGGAAEDGDSGPVDTGCSAPPEAYQETEPNDGDGQYDTFDSDGGDITIEGSISCSNNGSSWTGDIDWYVADFPCADNARVTVNWGGYSDLDFWVFDADIDPLTSNIDEDYSGPVTEPAYASDRIYVGVACWWGTTVSYTVEIDFEPWGWTPPAGDDDDSSPSDDDDFASGDGQDDDEQSGSGQDSGGDEADNGTGSETEGNDEGTSTDDGQGDDADEITEDSLPLRDGRSQTGCACSAVTRTPSAWFLLTLPAWALVRRRGFSPGLGAP